MRISLIGRGTYYARKYLKTYGLRWNAGNKTWVGDVDRSTVTLIRELMRTLKNVRLVFEDPAEAEEYYGFPVWECGGCSNYIRREDCQAIGATSYKCPFCGRISRLLLDEEE